MNAPGEVVVAEGDAHAACAAELLARAIHDGAMRRGVAHVALSGGSTPGEAYRVLCELALPWSQVRWFWVDERAVPPDHPRSNVRAATADLGLEDGPPAAGTVHRMVGEAPDLAAEARRYESLLRASFGVAAAVAFDALVLGVGEDGHTASLFPGRPEVDLDDRLVCAVPAQPERGLEPRLSLTTPVLREARHVVVLARGAGKRGPLTRAWSPGDLREVPARLVQAARGQVTWVLDAAARPD